MAAGSTCWRHDGPPTKTTPERTQVAVVGAGPAGLLLSHLLHRSGIDSVVLETRSREHVESRVRAGVLEQPTTDLLRAAGLGERMDREGVVHGGTSLRFDGEDHRIDFADLVGATITVNGQQEVVKDLIAAPDAVDGRVEFEVADVVVRGIDGEAPAVTYVDARGRGATAGLRRGRRLRRLPRRHPRNAAAGPASRA